MTAWRSEDDAHRSVLQGEADFDPKPKKYRIVRLKAVNKRTAADGKHEDNILPLHKLATGEWLLSWFFRSLVSMEQQGLRLRKTQTSRLCMT